MTPVMLMSIPMPWDGFLREAAVPPTRTLRQFAQDEIIIPDGPHEGERFRVDVQPWTGLLFDEVDHGEWAEIITTAPSQSGKTLVLFVLPVLWTAVEMQHNTVIGLPDIEMWGDKFGIDIAPVMRAAPRLVSLQPTKGKGARGGQPNGPVTLGNGVVLKPMTPSGGEWTRSGFTSPYIIVTELYRFDGDPFHDLKARQGAYNQFLDDGQLSSERRVFAEGTCTEKDSLPWSARSSDDESAPPISTESEIYSPCPICGKYILFDREHLVGWQEANTELEAARLACWECPDCSKRFGEYERKDSVARCRLVHRGQKVDKRGIVRGDVPEVSRLFFRVNGYQNLLRNTPTLGAEEWKAAQNDKDTPAWIDAQRYMSTKVWAQPYERPVLDYVPLRAGWVRDNRIGRVPMNTLPSDTMFWTLGIDLGKWTCWYVGIAFRANGETPIVTFGAVDTSLIKGDKVQPVEVSSAIAATASRIGEEFSEGLTREDGEQLQPVVVCIDSGYHPDGAFAAAKRFGRDWIPVLGRGKSQHNSRVYSRPSKIGAEVVMIGDGFHLSYVRSRGWHQMTLDADKSKLDVQSGLRVQPGEPGAIQLPKAVSKYELRKLAGHLAAEVLIQERDEYGQMKEQWRTTRGRHDLLDAAGYALVGGRYHQDVLSRLQTNTTSSADRDSGPLVDLVNR